MLPGRERRRRRCGCRTLLSMVLSVLVISGEGSVDLGMAVEKHPDARSIFQQEERFEHESAPKKENVAQRKEQDEQVYEQIEKIEDMEGKPAKAQDFARMAQKEQPQTAQRQPPRPIVPKPQSKAQDEQVYEQIEKIEDMEGNPGKAEHFEKLEAKSQHRSSQNRVVTGGGNRQEMNKDYCPAGKVRQQENSYVCVLCAPGKYSFGGQITWCEHCPAGRFGTGGSETRDCSGACPPGRFGVQGAPSKACSGMCPAGQYSEVGATKCLSCPAGRYSAAQGAITCNFCEPGQYDEFPGVTECAKCPKGKFQRAHGMTSCESIPKKEVVVDLHMQGGITPKKFTTARQQYLIIALANALDTVPQDVRIARVFGETSVTAEMHIKTLNAFTAQTVKAAIQSRSFGARLSSQIKQMSELRGGVMASEKIVMGRAHTQDIGSGVNDAETDFMTPMIAFGGILLVLMLASYWYKTRSMLQRLGAVDGSYKKLHTEMGENDDDGEDEGNDEFELNPSSSGSSSSNKAPGGKPKQTAHLTRRISRDI